MGENAKGLRRSRWASEFAHSRQEFKRLPRDEQAARLLADIQRVSQERYGGSGFGHISYDRRRAPGYPSGRTAVVLLGVECWDDVLGLAGLPPPPRSVPHAKRDEGFPHAALQEVGEAMESARRALADAEWGYGLLVYRVYETATAIHYCLR